MPPPPPQSPPRSPPSDSEPTLLRRHRSTCWPAHSSRHPAHPPPADAPASPPPTPRSPPPPLQPARCPPARTGLRAARKPSSPPAPPPRAPAAPPPPPPAPFPPPPRHSVLRRAARALRAAAAAAHPPPRHPQAPSRGLAAARSAPPQAPAAPGTPTAAVDREGAGRLMRRLLRHNSRPPTASRSRRAEVGSLWAHAQVRRHRAARRGLAAVLAAPLEGSDRPLSRPAPVGLGHRHAALGAAARLLEAVPAVGAVAVALVALVDDALGQRQADTALQGLRHRSA
eukprot:scaffold75250_cov63-Phaeocystis_antarctica.AAC.3